MSTAAHQKEITGRHVLAMLVAFFGVIIGVNLLMAWFANSTWSGLVVPNGYVASQSFDEDLARVRAQEAMGWKVGVSFTEGRVRLTFEDAAGGKIDGLTVTAALKRPVTTSQDQALAFMPMGAGVYSAPARLSPGLWDVAVDARAEAGVSYRKTFRLMAAGESQ